jgi:UBX domain-containing protein 1
MPGFRSISDFNKDDEDPNKLNSYAGGNNDGRGSGLAVEHPPDANDPWAGARHAQASGPAGADENVVTVYVFTDGFIVDNGPFRPLAEPENAAFMNSLRSGVAPEELGEGRTGPVRVQVMDKGAPYDGVHPHAKGAGKGSAGTRVGASAGPAVQAFSGEGMSLGGGKTADLNKDAATSTVDQSKPVTKLQVRFHDGTRKAAEFNEDATVQQVHNFVAAAVGAASFQILGGFPPKPLTDMGATLKDAGLLNAAVTVKLT